MQKPEKSCSQCRARKTKCNLMLPRCSSCITRNLVCRFDSKKKPGPPKGFKKQVFSGKDYHSSENGKRLRRNLDSPEGSILSKSPNGQSSPPYEVHPSLLDIGSGDGGSMMDDSTLQPTISFDALQTLEDGLVEAYSTMKLFPYLPQVRKQDLPDPEVNGTLRSALVNALCAVSAHSASDAMFEHVPVTRTEAAEMFATCARSAYLRCTREEDHPTTLSVIKTAAILAFYEMSCSPDIKSWFTIGEAVRLSYDMRLDQLDSKSYLTSAFMSAEEAEDARYTWWSIYALDCYASSTLFRPFAITSNSISTALVSTPEGLFQMGSVNPTQGISLPSDPVELQTTVLSLNHRDTLDTQTLYLLILSFVRLIADMRTKQLDGIEVEIRSDLMQNTLATMRLSIPANFLDHKGSFEERHLRLTRMEIVLLLELQTLSLYSCQSSKDLLQDSSSTGAAFEPLGQTKSPGYNDGTSSNLSYNSEWYTCIQSAFTTVRVVRNLSSEEFSRISPTMAAVLWLPALTLVLYHKSRSDAEERTNAASSTEVLKAALKRMGNTWVIAQNFHDALEALRAGPATASTELHVQYILRSYGSPLVSVSCRRNNVHMPSLMIPYFSQSENFQEWILPGGF